MILAIYLIAIISADIIMGMIYNKKRREILREKYKDESCESRRRGVAWVWFYEILSIAFLVFALSMIEFPR
jgi:hypothetical protein